MQSQYGSVLVFLGFPYLVFFSRRTSNILPMQLHKKTYGMLLAILYIFFAIKLIIVFWGANRGFDIGDEGFYLLTYQHPTLYEACHWGLSISSIFGFVELNISNSRIIRAIIEILGIIFLTAGFYHWNVSPNGILQKAGKKFRNLLFPVALTGSFLSIYARGLSYNDVSTLFAYSASACLFYILSLNPSEIGKKRSPKSMLALLGCGYFIGYLFFVKFPTSILLFAAIALLLTYSCRNQAFIHHLSVFAWITVGLTAAATTYFFLYGSPNLWAQNFVRDANIYDLLGYGIFDILTGYVRFDRITLLLVLVGLGILCLIFPIRTRLLSLKDSLSFAISFFLAEAIMIGGIHWVGLEYYSPILVSCFTSYFLIILVLCSIILFNNTSSSSFNAKKKAPALPSIKRDNLIVMFFLWALPFIVVLGTNHAPLSEAMFQNFTPWAILLLLLVEYVYARLIHLRRFAILLLVLFLLGTQIQFSYHYLWLPWGLPSNLFEQKHSVSEIGQSLKADMETKIFFETFLKKLNAAGIHESDPIIIFDNMPGLQHLSKTYSPQTPVFLKDSKGFNDFSCHYLNKLDKENLSKPPMVIFRTPLDDHILNCLNKSVLNFSDGYELLDSIYTPYSKNFDYLFDSNKHRHIHLYIPKNHLGL